MSSDSANRAALLEQLRQKRQRGEKNKYEADSEGNTINDEPDEEVSDNDEKPSKKRAKITVATKKLDELGFSISSEPIESTAVPNIATASADGSIANVTSSKPDSTEKPLEFYCLDAYEDTVKKPGDVYLFGRTKSDLGDYLSCCARVRSIKRRVFILPRKNKIDSRTGKEIGETITFGDVEEELMKELKRLHIKGFVVTKPPKSRKYCLAAAVDVPSEAEYLEIRYPFNQPQLPLNFSGSTFSHSFGTTSTGLEILLLECRLRLPCWIECQKAVKSSVPFSWCAVEVDVENFDASDLRILSDKTILPPLSVLSIAVKPMPVDKGQKEVVAIGLWFNSTYYLDKDKQDEAAWRHMCIIRKGAEHAHLYDFKAKLAKETFTRVKVEENERALLSSALTEIQKFNPDIIVGHDLWDFELQTLIGRVFDKIPAQLQRLGRLRRGVPHHRPFTKFDVYDTMAGRLICDLKVMAMEFILRSKSYDLTELASQMLTIERIEIAEEAVKEVYNSSESLISFVKFAVTDAGLCWRLMAKLCCLQLTSEITRIVGGVWSKTLAGGRAERTEFLLLHAFEAAGYIAPEKIKAKKGLHKEVEELDDDEDHVAAVAARKKTSYVGGLVLEPKKGLYDNYVLLLDFNSLYPSIIMEYNVCFTTISQRKFMDGTDNDGIPPLPESGLPPGILPNEIRKLVESRKAVKQLMKDPKATAERYQELNIRQQALKITANSMYGCLGFSSSRFYAKPLAALITSQGREILMDTKVLVEKMHLEVVYGDTDSIMINTHSEKLDDVMELGTKVKLEVRKKYRQLELDIDGVYKKLLLYKKKKYAGLMVESPATAAKQGEIKVKREMKGLDIVRRDCPPIAVEAGSHVLDELLSDNETSASLERIFAYLTRLAGNMRNGDIPIEKYEVSKQLSRPPTEYGDKKQPHVSVALRLNANGRHLKQGDVVSYIICENGTSDAPLQRAYHRSEIESNKDLKIDISYCLSQQVHPVVTRLLEPIKGADAYKVAECLGLDTSSYRRHITSVTNSKDILNATSQFDDFSGCVPFAFKCLECKTENEVLGVFVNKNNEIKPTFLKCANSTCTAEPGRNRDMMLNRLLTVLRQLIKKHYQNWLVCDECAHRTRRAVLEVGARGMAKCPSCNQISLHQEYSAQHLYSQLAYFQAVFDWNAAVAKLPRGQKGISCDPATRNLYDEMKRMVDALVSRNGYAQIDLGKLFKCFM